jgi:hypothetical protein
MTCSDDFSSGTGVVTAALLVRSGGRHDRVGHRMFADQRREFPAGWRQLETCELEPGPKQRTTAGGKRQQCAELAAISGTADS